MKRRRFLTLAPASMAISAVIGLGALSFVQGQTPDALRQKQEEKLQGALDAVVQKRRAEVRDLEHRASEKREEVKRQLEDIRISPSLEVIKAESEFQNAKLAREIAEFAVKEYEEGILPQELAKARGEIELAEAGLRKAKERFDKEGRPIDQLDVRRAEYTLEKNQVRLDVLTRFDKEVRLKELQSDVEKARAEELSREAKLYIAKQKESSAKREVETYHARAPEDIILLSLQDAIQKDRRLLSVVREAAKLQDQINAKVEEIALLSDKLEPKQAEAKALAEGAKRGLSRAVDLAVQLTQIRADLLEEEIQLKQARDRLELLEKMFHIPPQYDEPVGLKAP